MSINEGVAGQVVRNRMPMRVSDAYKSQHFNSAVDKKTKYCTKSLLCIPIMINGQVHAAAMLLNKLNTLVCLPVPNPALHTTRGPPPASQFWGVSHLRLSQPLFSFPFLCPSDVAFLFFFPALFEPHANHKGTVVDFTDDDMQVFLSFEHVLGSSLSRCPKPWLLML